MSEAPIIVEIKNLAERMRNVKTLDNALIVCGKESIKLQIHILNILGHDLDVVVWKDCPEDTIYVFSKTEEWTKEELIRRHNDKNKYR